MQGGQFDTADNLTPRTIWHHHKFYISAIVWPRNIIRNILIATIYLFDWKLSCIMSLYQIRARQGPHIKTYLISWQLFGPKISLEIHCWPITTFFKTVGENFAMKSGQVAAGFWFDFLCVILWCKETLPSKRAPDKGTRKKASLERCYPSPPVSI